MCLAVKDITNPLVPEELRSWCLKHNCTSLTARHMTRFTNTGCIYQLGPGLLKLIHCKQYDSALEKSAVLLNFDNHKSKKLFLSFGHCLSLLYLFY